MTSPYRDLYQDVILDHGRRPRNFRTMDQALKAEGHNPLCGDRLTVYARVEQGVVADVSFVGQGCAISTASASMMTGAVKGKTVEEAMALHARFHETLAGGADSRSAGEGLGKLAVFEGVREFPSRVKCATLAWHTLRAALERRAEPVTTEGS